MNEATKEGKEIFSHNVFTTTATGGRMHIPMVGERGCCWNIASTGKHRKAATTRKWEQAMGEKGELLRRLGKRWNRDERAG